MKVGCFVVFQLRLVYFQQLLLDLFSVTTHRMMLIFLKPCKYNCILQKCRQVKKTPSVPIFKITKGNLSEVNNVKKSYHWLFLLMLTYVVLVHQILLHKGSSFCPPHLAN